MSDDPFIRCDRVALSKTNGWEGAIAWLGSSDYGDLWVTRSGRVGYSKTKWYNDDWATTLSEITDVRAVSRGTGLRYGQGAMPSRLLQFSAGSDTFIVRFTGLTSFLSTSEKLISHIPGVHHVGALIVDTKKAWENRGSGARAEEARQAWWDLLHDSAALENLPAVSVGS